MAYDIGHMCLRCLYLFIVLAVTSITWAQSKEVCHDTNLPSQIQLLLKDKFPGWRPKHLLDLVTDDQKLWLETRGKECPGIVRGHFERPDQIAYAILLIQKIKTSESYKIIVLSKISDQYALRILDSGDQGIELNSDSGLIISKELPGTYAGCCESKSIHLRLDAVNVEWLEKSSILYYWSQGKYQSLETSD